MLKAVIFDLDDTLYNFKNLEPFAILQVFERIKKDYKLEKLDNILLKAKIITKGKVPLQAASHNRLIYFQTMLEILDIPPLPLALELNNIFWDYILDHMSLNEGVLETLDILKKNKIKVGICTDLGIEVQYKKIQKLNICPYINAIVTSEEVGYEKPNCIMFKTILNKLDVHVQDSLFIGDNYEKDYIGSNAIGMKAVLFSKNVKSGIKSIDSFKKLGENIYELYNR